MTRKKIILSHPYGNQFMRALLVALDQSELLEKYYTLLAVEPKDPVLKLLPESIKSELLRRAFPIDTHRIESSRYKFLEIGRTALNRLGIRGKNYDIIEYINRKFDKSVSLKLHNMVKRHQLGAVYGIEDVALETFRSAKSHGLKCIYDLPIAYWAHGRKLMQEEAERLPDWAITLSGGIEDPPKKLDQKTKEIELADLVVVPSNFVKDSIPASIPRDKILVSPFGTPEELPSIDKSPRNKDRPLRILFTGIMTQRKGLGDLFAAMKLVDNPNIELVVLGAPTTSMDFYKNQFSDFTHEAGRPHHEVLQLMQTCDVFCLPSIVEGRALVMQEAMSQGLPLIITPNTGGDDLVIEGKTGFLVPIRSPESIAEKIIWFNENRDRIPEMARLAQERAASYTWKAYADKIVGAIEEIL